MLAECINGAIVESGGSCVCVCVCVCVNPDVSVNFPLLILLPYKSRGSIWRHFCFCNDFFFLFEY
jgi:hypothetical protein